MTLDYSKQFHSLIKRSEKILFLLPKSPSCDVLAASLALFNLLKRSNISIDIVSPNFVLEDRIKFFQDIHNIKPSLVRSNKLIIQLDISKNKIDQFSYNIEGDYLKIFITPKNSPIPKDNVKILENNAQYDLIISFGIQVLDDLGQVFSDNTDLFFSTSVINIDNHPYNDQYGHLNIVDIKSSSISEICFSLFKDKLEIFDETVATLLLTGIIDSTNSFKKNNITPDTLLVVKQLIEAGANREKIIDNLYRKNKLSSVRLLGRAFANLDYDPQYKIVWSKLSNNDFLKTKSKIKATSYILKELVNNSPNANIVVLFYETPFGEVEVFVNSVRNILLDSFFVKHKEYACKYNKNQISLRFKNNTLEKVKDIVLSDLRSLSVQ